MRPLDGITVIDVTRALSGPYCTMLLADMGARVIKIEPPASGDETRGWGPPFLGRESAYFLSINRNKESVTLDLQHPDGRALLARLASTCDVLVENGRPGAMARLQLDYASLSAANPGLVYGSISGFGQTGPRRTEAGYDIAMQAEGGLMSITGSPDRPPVRVGVAVADIVTGMFAMQGILLALLGRARTGRGQHVDVAMLDAVAALLSYQAGHYFATGVPPTRLGNRHPSIVPYDTFAAADGDFVLAIGNDRQWERLRSILDLPDEEGRFATNRQRVELYDELRPMLDRRLRHETRSAWIERLNAAGIPCGSVRDLGELFADPQLAAREMVVSIDHPTSGPLRQLGIPVKLSDTPGAIVTPPPTLGQHTTAVLRDDLGLDPSAIDRLRAGGIV